MQIGSVLASRAGTATLGCFVYKPGQRGLYAIVSLHGFGKGETVLRNNVCIGSVVDTTNADLDASLVKIGQFTASSLTKDAFKIRRGQQQIKLKRALDPTKIRAAKDQPLTSPERMHIEALHYMVWHEGQTSKFMAEQNLDTFSYNSQFGVLAAKDIMKGRYIFEERPTRHGDSGGPIYLDNGELVGFMGGGISKPLPPIRMGDALQPDIGSAGGFYRLAYDVFTALHVELATWGNRHDWTEDTSSILEDFADFEPGDEAWVTPGK